MPIGARIREVRKARGLKGIELAALVGCNSSAVTRWEKGGGDSEGRVPGSEWVAKLAAALGVNAHWLLTGEGAMERASATSAGAEALADVLADYDWGDLDMDVIDAAEQALRLEAQSEPGTLRSPSAWRARIRHMLAERASRSKQRARSPR